MLELSVREGSVADEASVLALFDESVRWLVARGQPGQWGSEPWSEQPEACALINRTLRDSEVRIAEHDTEVVGALAVGSSPPYVPGTPVPELYVTLLISARRLSGHGVGAHLLDLATEMALERRARMMRVDCWADSPALIAFYEQQGFTRQGQFDLRGWRGQVLGKLL
ncbi:MAG: GNAT family N-acetyltransferase [Actinomycetota bacterium]|nr:GNAT family N-acetyltransferase [Actinomycetota bacterium]